MPSILTILSFSVTVILMFFENNVQKFKHQPSHLKVKVSKDRKHTLSKHFKTNDKLRTHIPRILVPCKCAELIQTGGGIVTNWWLKYMKVSMPAQWKKRYSLCFVLPFTNLNRKQTIKIKRTVTYL
jgi:hypothetical protein